MKITGGSEKDGPNLGGREAQILWDIISGQWWLAARIRSTRENASSCIFCIKKSLVTAPPTTA